ncbi:MAG TPA: PRC-barrel domain-containing protein [Pirellulales bacterium]|jgi:hypothetical protein|nr:PRC-barrel domain-containing protein [Pirellulales bacterium]
MSIPQVSRRLLVAALASGIVVCAATFVAISQAQTPDRRLDRTQTQMDSGRGFKASELIGQSVYSPGDQEKGKIKDLMISPNGHIEYAAVSFGGFLGIGDKLFAVPLDAIHLEWKDNKVNHARVDVTEETIKQRQGFDDNHWPEHADRGFLTNEAQRTGVEPNPANR